jgi:hypothetical protein
LFKRFANRGSVMECAAVRRFPMFGQSRERPKLCTALRDAGANDERDFDVLLFGQVRGEDLNINAQARGE